MTPDWKIIYFDSSVCRIHARYSPELSQSGEPLLLLHGHPQTHAMWHRVAPELARSHRVVLMDLPGYGDSARPAVDGAQLNPYSKRAMASAAWELMRHLGHERFGVLAHDRGARVAHRLAMDASDAVTRMMLLDIAPTLAMYSNTTREFATLYWHWFFLIQPPPLPEALIESDPVRYIRSLMGARRGGLSIFDAQAMAAYERAVQIPGSARAMCEDYRTAAGVDLEHDRADIAAGRVLEQPLRVLWGEHGAVNRCFDVLQLWRERARQVSGAVLPSGHYIAEEVPGLLISEAISFFGANRSNPNTSLQESPTT